MDVRQIIEALGTKATVAATGAVSNSKYFMAYIKQIVTAVIAIKERTDLIPDDPADQSEIVAEINANEALLNTVLDEILGTNRQWSDMQGETISSLDLALQYLAAVIGMNGANTFAPVVGGIARTSLEKVYNALDYVLQVVDANIDWIKEAAGNDSWGFGALRNHILANKALLETISTNVDWIKEAAGNDDWGFGALRNEINANETKLDAVQASLDAMGDIVTKDEAGVVDKIWDEALTGATHNVATSAAKRIRELAGSVVRAETAQGADDSTHITLDVDASATNDIYTYTYIVLVGGTGVGQARHIMDYVGSSKKAEVYPAWVTTPDNTSEYVIFGQSMAHVHMIEQDGLDQINAEADIALNTAVPEPPTAKSLQDILHKDTNYTYSKATDALEAIRDRIDTLNSADQIDLDAIIAFLGHATYGLDAIKTLLNTYAAILNTLDTRTATIVTGYLANATFGLNAILDSIIANGVTLGTLDTRTATIVTDYLAHASYGLDAIKSALNTANNIIPSLRSNLARWGVVDSVDGNSFVSADLAGLGVDAMPGWYVYVMQADNAAPEGERRLLTDYANDGDCDHEAFSVALEVGDRVQLLHPSIGMLGQVDTAAAEGVVTTTDFMMAYIKQLVTAAIALATAVGNIPTTMVGTNNAALASVLEDAMQKASPNYNQDTDSLEALRELLDTIAGDVANIDGSSIPAMRGTDNAATETKQDIIDGVVDNIKTSTDKLAGASPSVGTATEDWNTAEADIVSVGANNTKNKLHSLVLDISGLTATATITIRMYMQVNGNEKMVYEQDFVVGTDPDGLWIVNGTVAIHEVLRVTAESDDATDDGLTIAYDYMLEVM